MLTPLTAAAIFLVLTVDAGGEDGSSRPPRRRRRASAGRWDSGSRTASWNASSASDRRPWDRLFAGPRPAELHPFRPLAGRATAPATPGDLLFHLRARRMDLCFELATQLMDRLRGAATVVDEVHGFKYFDERDLLGFVDGTENPTGPDALRAAVIDRRRGPGRSPAAAT